MANIAVRQDQLETVQEKSFQELEESIEAGLNRDKGKQVQSVAGEELYSPTVGPMTFSCISTRIPSFSSTLLDSTTQSHPTVSAPYTQSQFSHNPAHTQVIHSQVHTVPISIYPANSQLQSPVYSASIPMPSFPFSSRLLPTTMPAPMNPQFYSLPIAPPPHPPQTLIQARTHPTTRFLHYTPYLQSFTRLSKVEFLRFNGRDYKSWCYKVDQFFSLDEIPSHQKVTVGALHLDDIAIQWHLAYMRSRQHLPPPSWEEYLYALADSFGDEFDDPMAELVRLKQTGHRLLFAIVDMYPQNKSLRCWISTFVVSRHYRHFDIFEEAEANKSEG